jgi:hypothetical protein
MDTSKYAEPTSEIAQPVSETIRPVPDNTQPVAEGAQPTSETVQQASENAQPASENNQPVSENVQLAPENAQPIESSPSEARYDGDKMQISSSQPQGQDEGIVPPEAKKDAPENDAETRTVEEKLREALEHEDTTVTEKAPDLQSQEVDGVNTRQMPIPDSDVAQTVEGEPTAANHDVEAKDSTVVVTEAAQSDGKPEEQSVAPEEHETAQKRTQEDAVWEEFERERTAQEILARGK